MCRYNLLHHDNVIFLDSNSHPILCLALFQILNPMVAETINNKNIPKLEKLYKKSSSNLFLISGLISVLICCNIDDIYEIIYTLNSNYGFRLAIPVVFYISLSKLFIFSNT